MSNSNEFAGGLSILIILRQRGGHGPAFESDGLLPHILPIRRPHQYCRGRRSDRAHFPKKGASFQNERLQKIPVGLMRTLNGFFPSLLNTRTNRVWTDWPRAESGHRKMLHSKTVAKKRLRQIGPDLNGNDYSQRRPLRQTELRQTHFHGRR